MNSTTALAFAVTLLVAVLLSGRTQRSALSTAVIFLIAGFISGPTILGLGDIEPWDEIESTLVELALVSVLFSDGMSVNLRMPREQWRLPGRALLLGMPLTFTIVTVLTRLLFDFSWLESALVGAILSPTDPLFASLIIERKVIPERIRRLLNVESGVNDGIVLPVILVLLQLMREDTIHPLALGAELIGGVLIGVIVPWAIIKLERSGSIQIAAVYEPLNAFAIGFLILIICIVTGANEFLAAFCAGAVIGTMSAEVRQEFHEFGEILTELLKNLALFLFGMLVSLEPFFNRGVLPYLFAAAVLLVARPLPIMLVLARQPLPMLEKWTVAWFGPKGFSSIFYALLVASSPVQNRLALFEVLSLTVVVSIVAHSSTDYLFARRFEQQEAQQE